MVGSFVDAVAGSRLRDCVPIRGDLSRYHAADRAGSKAGTLVGEWRSCSAGVTAPRSSQRSADPRSRVEPDFWRESRQRSLAISGGEMFTTEVAAFGQRTNFEDLDRNIEWERAARILDLDPRMVRRLHKPRMECVSRQECVALGASLYVAAGPRNC